MNYKVNKDKSFIEKGGGAGKKPLPDYSKGYGVPKKGKTTLPDKTAAQRLIDGVGGEEGYNKLSDENKKSFDAAAKKAGLPTKKVKPEEVKKNQEKDDPAMNIDRASGKGN